MKIYKKHDDSATLSESIIIISNNVKVCNRNNYIKINKQTGSKTSYHLFNMIGVDQNRFLGVKQIKSAIAFLANVS